MSLNRVGIIGTGSYLPGLPVPGDRVEKILGPITHAPVKVQSFIQNMERRVIDQGGVHTRHFAIDPETGNMTHSFSTLAHEAALRALQMAGIDAQEIDLLIIGCPSYDQSTPPTSALLQERLAIPHCAEMEIHSNCSGVGKGMQIAYDALRCGRYKTALVCYSQLSSVYLRSCYFNQSKINKVNAALRWILADGAGAVVLTATNNGTPLQHEVVGTYVESVGADRPAGMTAGGAVADLAMTDQQIPELYDDGKHHLWQDFTAVNDRAAPLLLDGIVRMTESLEIDTKSVDHYVVSIPTLKLYEQHIPAFVDKLGVSREGIKFRSGKMGYCGGAATLIQLDQMVRSGELQPGQLAVVHAVESSKWMTAGFAVRW